MTTAESQTLQIRFSGRILDHLGIQMYQSPTAAIAELIANAWDAGAKNVNITVPEKLTENATIVIEDDGEGMTLDECQNRYLHVGYNRRGTAQAASHPNGRPVLGRKGIGKFAGFGIAKVIEITTVSAKDQQQTSFSLDLDQLRSGEYLGSAQTIHATVVGSTSQPGTKVVLRGLTIARGISAERFRQSMANRFLLLDWVNQFAVTVNGQPLPDQDTSNVEFEFPEEYSPQELERLPGLKIEDGWGVEEIEPGKSVRWRVRFMNTPVADDELTGVAVFAGVKLAQRPFFFNLAGGLGGQHGQEYLAGTVKADYLDQLPEDVISTERQRINWDLASTASLLDWGQKRLKELLVIWKSRRSSAKHQVLQSKLAIYNTRLQNFSSHERKTVETALMRLGTISSLSTASFEAAADAVLLAWEKGRLRELIRSIADTPDEVGPERLLELLHEADVLTALNIAEVVKTKIESIRVLKGHIKSRLKENSIRDYIATKPYLLDPKWETFKKERRVEHLLQSAAKTAKLNAAVYKGRIDLAMSSGSELLIVEFMRPGLVADYDHLSRCLQYVSIVSDEVSKNSGLGFRGVSGLIVADQLGKSVGIGKMLETLAGANILAIDWSALLASAEKHQQDYLDIVASRSPQDDRIAELQAAAIEPKPQKATSVGEASQQRKPLPLSAQRSRSADGRKSKNKRSRNRKK